MCARAGKCQKGSGKRFPEDSAAQGWMRSLQDADASRRGVHSTHGRTGVAVGSPWAQASPPAVGERCCPALEGGSGVSVVRGRWFHCPPSHAEVGLGDVVPLVKV